MTTLTITKTQLQEVMRAWEQEFRDGKTLSHEECLAMAAEEIADERTDHLWKCLGGTDEE